MYIVIVLDDDPPPPALQGTNLLLVPADEPPGTVELAPRGLVVAVVDSIAQLGDPATWPAAAAVVVDAANDEREGRRGGRPPV